MSPASPSANLLKQCRPRPSSAAHTTVTIEVGSEKKAYYIHENLLTHCSRHFRAALTGSFKEAKEKQLHLEDVTRKTFDAFVDWLYLRSLPNLPKQKSPHAGDELSHTDDESFLNSHEITKVHIFADRYDIPDLRRDTIDMMFAYFKSEKKIPTAETITMAFGSLPDTSLLRKLLVHRYCESISNVTPEDELLWTHEILHVVLARYREIIQGSRYLLDLDLCDYHGHANEKEKKKCQKKREAQEQYD